MQATRKILSIESKTAFVATLQQVDVAALNAAIIKAAGAPFLCTLPAPLREKLNALQLAYQQHNDSVRPFLQQAITAYMQSEGCALFKAKLTQPVTDADWPTDLFYVLADELKLPLQATPIVQATIKEGKVYWRVLQNGAVVYQRHQGVEFTAANSWECDWKVFREFMDSGKRFSPVRITKERFVGQFTDECYTLAEAIWEELKNKGIINAKNKLSHGWRALSKQYVQLETLHRIKARTVKETDSLRVENYRLVASMLYRMANDEHYAEKIVAIPGAKIFRKERVEKTWASTGKVNYKKSDENCTKLWDVSIYAELCAYRRSALEKKSYVKILNYDHIPSAAILYEAPSVYKTAFDNRVQQIDVELANIAVTLAHYDLRNAPRDSLLAGRQTQLWQEKAQLQHAHAYETNEFSYTIAIPVDLHHAGETFMASATEQNAFKGNAFLRDVRAHVHHIETRPAEYHLKGDNIDLKSLGAFRYLYHASIKPACVVPGTHWQLGKHNPGFFKPADRQQLDQFFIEKMQAAMRKR